MCHTLHPYYAGNDKLDKQSLRHGCDAPPPKLTPLTGRVKEARNVNTIKDGM